MVTADPPLFVFETANSNSVQDALIQGKILVNVPLFEGFNKFKKKYEFERRITRCTEFPGIPSIDDCKRFAKEFKWAFASIDRL